MNGVIISLLLLAAGDAAAPQAASQAPRASSHVQVMASARIISAEQIGFGQVKGDIQSKGGIKLTQSDRSAGQMTDVSGQDINLVEFH